MVALVASRVWLDSLRPITDTYGELVDVTAIVQVAFRDEDTGEEIVRPKNVSSFGMMTPEQLAGVQSIYQSMITGLRTQYGIPEPPPPPAPEPPPEAPQ